MNKFMLMKKYTVNNLERKIFILLCLISFSVFVFTSDGHRYTIDEHHSQQQVLRLVDMIPDPSYIQGESKMLFHTPNMNPYNSGLLCKNAILCYPTYIGHAILEYPFVWINNTFEIINSKKFGIEGGNIAIGKLSGRAGVQKVLDDLNINTGHKSEGAKG